MSVIRPIIEYFEIDYVPTKRDAGWEFLDDTNDRQNSLKKLLLEASGVYIFYDSMGRAIYVGKAKRLSLYKEMKSAYNRSRGEHQKIWRVKHIYQQRVFEPHREAARKLERAEMYLHEVASYFSCYEVDMELINSVEALLIRAFANQLTNKRKERFLLKPEVE